MSMGGLTEVLHESIPNHFMSKNIVSTVVVYCEDTEAETLTVFDRPKTSHHAEQYTINSLKVMAG